MGIRRIAIAAAVVVALVLSGVDVRVRVPEGLFAAIEFSSAEAAKRTSSRRTMPDMDKSDDPPAPPPPPPPPPKKTTDNKKNDKKNDDDDDDDGSPSKVVAKNDDTKKQAQSGQSAQSAQAAIPSTLAALLKQWFDPSDAGKPATSAPDASKSLPSPSTSNTARTLPKPHTASDLTSKQVVPQANQATAKAAATVTTAAVKAAPRPVANLKGALPTIVHNEILVSNLTATTLQRAMDRGFQVKDSRTFRILNTTITDLTLPSDMTLADARAFLGQLDAAVSPNRYYRLHPSSAQEEGGYHRSPQPARETGGCRSDICYGATTIGWAPELGSCARGLKIGVIDTGYDYTHPSFKGRQINFGTFGPAARGNRADLHGTGVLALLAGDPHSSTPGLIPGAIFHVADIFFADDNGMPVSTTIYLLNALEWMDTQGVQIINLSLSGPSDELVATAIARMSKQRGDNYGTKPGVIFVAAAGNGGPGAPSSYPAAYPQVVAVTAVDRDLHGYRRANHGDYIDVAAPGVNVWTALPDGGHGFQSGTSFAAPYMTAVAAAVYRSLPRSATSKEAIFQRVSFLDLGDPGRDKVYGRGLVHAPSSCNPGGAKPAPLLVKQPSPGQRTAARGL